MKSEYDDKLKQFKQSKSKKTCQCTMKNRLQHIIQSLKDDTLPQKLCDKLLRSVLDKIRNERHLKFTACGQELYIMICTVFKENNQSNPS